MILQAEDGEAIEGSTMITAGCGHRAWVSPSGQAALRNDPTLPTRCSRCMPTGPFEFRMVPGAYEELIAEMGADTAEVIIEVVTAFGRARRSSP